LIIRLIENVNVTLKTDFSWLKKAKQSPALALAKAVPSSRAPSTFAPKQFLRTLCVCIEPSLAARLSNVADNQPF
jgi:hypothetical protein